MIDSDGWCLLASSMDTFNFYLSIFNFHLFWCVSKKYPSMGYRFYYQNSQLQRQRTSLHFNVTFNQTLLWNIVDVLLVVCLIQPSSAAAERVFFSRLSTFIRRVVGYNTLQDILELTGAIKVSGMISMFIVPSRLYK